MAELFNNAKPNEKVDSKKERIELEEKATFPELLSAGYMSLSDLSKVVNGLFYSVFDDFFGSKLELDPQTGRIQSRIFFSLSSDKSKDPSGCYAVEDANSGKNMNDIASRLSLANRLNNPTGNWKNIQLTAEGQSKLEDFLPNNAFNRNGGINWNAVTNEVTTAPSQFSRPQIYFSVDIDIYKVIKTVFGHKSSTGGIWNYNIEVKNPINPIQDPVTGKVTATNFNLLLWRVDSGDVYRLAERFGFNGLGSNSLGINTDR